LDSSLPALIVFWFRNVSIADDELALAAADRHQRVDRLEARLHRLVHRFARDDARRLDFDARHLGARKRALAVDRIAEAVHDAAEQGLADRHFDDGARALDDVAFLDVAVVAENHDADIVGFEVQRHALDAARELDHFAGLDVVETVDARDAVADGNDLAHFGHFGRHVELGDLVLEDRGNFGRTNAHRSVLRSSSGPARQGQVKTLELALQRGVDQAGTHLDLEAAQQGWIDFEVKCHFAACRRAQLGFELGQTRGRKARGRRHDGDRFAARFGELRAILGGDLGEIGEAAVARKRAHEAAHEIAHAEFGAHGEHGFFLGGAREQRAAHHALQIRTRCQRRFHGFEVGRNRVEILRIGEFVQCARIALGDSGGRGVLGGHARFLWSAVCFSAASAAARNLAKASKNNKKDHAKKTSFPHAGE
jgi:hypothetical protein